MTPLRELPELVQDSELQVTIRDNITIHFEPLECRDNFAPQTWELRRIIGRGGDGTVFLQHKIEGPGAVDMIAVKQMSLNADLASEDHDSKRYVRELEALAKFAQGRYSRYFVRSYGWYQEDGWLYSCMEYCKHLDLGKHLKTHGPLSEETTRVIAVQILQGLVQMHRSKIAHRDLKPANILIHRKPPEDGTWWVVLGDLGLSRRSGASSGTTTIRGTPTFMAPETIGEPFLGHPNSADPFRADMWCLGETISCALTGHGMFFNNEQFLWYQKGLERFPDSALKDSGASSDVIDLIRSLMDAEPLRRLTAAQALNHPWIKASHTSHVRTDSAAFSSTVQNSSGEASITIKESKNEPFGLENRKISEVNQPTQASAQWTQTLPIHSSNSKASQEWAATIADHQMQGISLSSLDKPASPGWNPESTTMHTTGTQALGQALSLSSSEEMELSLEQGFQKLRRVLEQRGLEWPDEPWKSFSSAEKPSISGGQTPLTIRARRRYLKPPKGRMNSNLNTSVPRSIEQKASIHKIESGQTSYVSPKAPQKEQEDPALELKRVLQTPEMHPQRHALIRAWLQMVTDGPSPRREEMQSPADLISFPDSESSAEMQITDYPQLQAILKDADCQRILDQEFGKALRRFGTAMTKAVG